MGSPLYTETHDVLFEQQHAQQSVSTVAHFMRKLILTQGGQPKADLYFTKSASERALPVQYLDALANIHNLSVNATTNHGGYCEVHPSSDKTSDS